MNMSSQESTLPATEIAKSRQRVSDLMPFSFPKPQVHTENTLAYEHIGGKNVFTFNQGDGVRKIQLPQSSSNNSLIFGKGITPDMLHFEKSSDFGPFFCQFKISLRGSQSEDSVIITEGLNEFFSLSSRFEDISVDGRTMPMKNVRAALFKDEQPVWPEKEVPSVINNHLVETLKTPNIHPTKIQMLADAMVSFGEHVLVSLGKDVISDVTSNIFRDITSIKLFDC